MKKSEKKEKLVSDLEKLCNSVDFSKLYTHPNQPVAKNWLNNAAGILKNLDSASYEEFVKLAIGAEPKMPRNTRKEAFLLISNFVGRKVAEFKNYDFSYLDERIRSNNWNLINPFWLVYKLVCWINKHRIFTGLIVIVGLLGIDYSLAWRNTQWLISLIITILK